MKTLLCIFSLLCFAFMACAEEVYWAIVESSTGRIIQKGGNLSASERYSPCSTFKIPIALIGYETGTLIDEDDPKLPYEGEPTFMESWKGLQTPRSWMRDSCVWYSQRITPLIGMERIKKCLIDFNYGNQDMSGGSGKDNGLTNAWLSSSLKISAGEQIAFMRKLALYELHISRESMDKTRRIIFLGELSHGWNFYGKTGTGLASGQDGNYLNNNLQAGWFVGWAEKEKTSYVIVMHMERYFAKELPAGPFAKKKCRQLLLESGLLK